MSESIRTFIAMELSELAKARIEQAIGSMKSQGLSGVRWVKPDGMHLTLKFLGGIAPPMAEKVTQAIQEACQGAKPFNLALSHTGAFPNLERPRVLWVGLSGDLEPLRELHGQIESQILRLGFPAETRRFSPHVTLGRVRDGVSSRERRLIGETLGRITVEDVPPWRVETVNLMKSTLTPAGAIYTPLTKTLLSQVLSVDCDG